MSVAGLINCKERGRDMGEGAGVYVLQASASVTQRPTHLNRWSGLPVTTILRAVVAGPISDAPGVDLGGVDS